MLTRYSLTLLLGAMTLALVACKDTKHTEDVEDPTLIDLPQNIREVTQLLRSAGHVPEVEPLLKTRRLGHHSSVPALEHYLEYSQLREDCDKITQPTEYTQTISTGNFFTLEAWPSILWAGNLLQGNSLQGRQAPTLIPLESKRLPGRISLQTATRLDSEREGGEQLWMEQVEEMDEASVTQAQRNLIARWQEHPGRANSNYSITLVRTPEEALLASGLDAAKYGELFRSTFGMNFDKEKQYALVRFYHHYYTLGYEAPEEGFRGIFKPSIQRADLAPYTNTGNPICYVSSVSYGRAYYLLFEGKTSDFYFLKELNGMLDGIAHRDLAYWRRNPLTYPVKMLQIGDPTMPQLVTSKPTSEVFEYLAQGSYPEPKDVGVPIYFTAKHLLDASSVRMSMTTSYTADKVEFVPRRKFNMLSVYMKDITVESRAEAGWKISNKAYVLIRDVAIRYRPVGNPSWIGKPFFKDKRASDLRPYLRGLHTTAGYSFFDIGFHETALGKDNRYGVASLEIELQVLPQTFSYSPSSGKERHSGTSPRTITLTREFRYDTTTDTWKPQPDEEGISGQPFHQLRAKRTRDHIQFDIRVNYAFFKDNVQLE